jgi:hypothetical protein
MRVLIVGLNHQIQRPFGSSDRRAVDFVLEQKHRFADAIREAIRSHGVEFVGEEANHREPSIAESVCNEEECRYANIEMPPEERTRRRIPPGYNERNEIAADEKTGWNRLVCRRFMCEQNGNSSDQPPGPRINRPKFESCSLAF